MRVGIISKQPPAVGVREGYTILAALGLVAIVNNAPAAGSVGAGWVYPWGMRAALVLSTICLLGLGCAAGPPQAPAAAAPEPSSERWPTAEEAAAWTISRDEALRIARDALEDQDPRHMIYRADPVVRAGEAFWRVTGGSTIAGGWIAEIDARTGAVLRSHHLPGR